MSVCLVVNNNHICLSVSEFFMAAKDVDIMIHEATMEDDLIKDAEQKNHR